MKGGCKDFFTLSRVTIFSLRKKRIDFLKAIRSADVQSSTQNQVKSKKKKIITSADVQSSTQNQVKSKKKGHHVRRP